MLSLWQAALLGLVQGITELFPISSLGHSVLLPSLLGWNIDQASSPFVSFVVATHLATALVLIGFFWRDWLKIIEGILRSLYRRRIGANDTYAKLGWLLIIGTIPAGLVGLVLDKKIEALFGAAELVACVLILNGVVLYAAELLRRRRGEMGEGDRRIARLSWMQDVLIGCAQCFALIPGFSRTGFTMTGGLLSGLSHEDAARFAFLLAAPIILAASILKVPSLFVSGSAILLPALVGAACAAIAAYLSVRFLTHYFKTNSLTPFAVYCVLAGVVSIALLAL